MGKLPDTLPIFLLPEVPLTFETLTIIFPYSFALMVVGLLESMMTATIVDDLTDSKSDKNRECKGQGIANIGAGLMGGMAGCAMIGQSIIAIKSGGRGRLVAFAAGVFLLDAVLFLVRALIPVAPGADGDILRAGLSMNVTYVGGMFVMLGHTFALVLMIVERQMVDLRRLARRDGLTGLLNRTALMGDGEEQLAQSLHQQQPFAAMLLDLDHFKRINDTRGHPVGDEVLHHAARTLQRSLRGRDWLLGRYGGEEFVLLLADTGMEQAMALAERLRATLEASPLHREGGPIVITVSIGVAVADAASGLESLLARADAALYRAKAAGRNRVACDLGVEPAPVP